MALLHRADLVPVDDGFVDILRKTLADAAVTPAGACVETTEDTKLNSTENAKRPIDARRHFVAGNDRQSVASNQRCHPLRTSGSGNPPSDTTSQRAPSLYALSAIERQTGTGVNSTAAVKMNEVLAGFYAKTRVLPRDDTSIETLPSPSINTPTSPFVYSPISPSASNPPRVEVAASSRLADRCSARQVVTFYS